MSQSIRVDHIDPNPKQPRKRFPEGHIADLAESIRKRELLQPITLRSKGKHAGVERFEIVAGECRWRAHLLLKRATIACNVMTMTDDEVALAAMVENLQRRDMNAMEEAFGFKGLMDRGFNAAQIVEELGLKSTALVTQRLQLLNLTDAVQALVTSGQLSPSMAWAVSLVPKQKQTQMVRDISSGKLKTAEQARHAGIAMREAAAQLNVFAPRSAPKTSKQDMQALERLEEHICKVEAMCAAGFKDGECVAARRVNPNRVEKMADKLAIARKTMLAMEQSLRNAAAASQMTLGGV